MIDVRRGGRQALRAHDVTVSPAIERDVVMEIAAALAGAGVAELDHVRIVARREGGYRITGLPPALTAADERKD